MSKFDTWAERFEPIHTKEWDSQQNRYVDVVYPAKCIYPINEGPHKRACHGEAPFRSSDGYRACAKHQWKPVKKLWRGHVEEV